MNVDPLLEKLRVKLVLILAPGRPCVSTPQITYFCPRSIWRNGVPFSLLFGHQAFIPSRRPNLGRKLDPLFELAVILSSGMTLSSSRIPTLVWLHVPVKMLDAFESILSQGRPWEVLAARIPCSVKHHHTKTVIPQIHVKYQNSEKHGIFHYFTLISL